VYVVEEEVYSDHDNSSVYTSEDDFDEDKLMFDHYIDLSDKYDSKMANLAEIARLEKLNPKKTERELRLERLGIINESRIELTEA
jgi:hypothetical protein